jgi:hypothetical protein
VAAGQHEPSFTSRKGQQRGIPNPGSIIAAAGAVSFVFFTFYIWSLSFVCFGCSSAGGAAGQHEAPFKTWKGQQRGVSDPGGISAAAGAIYSVFDTWMF